MRAIVAVTQDGVIGKDGSIPWKNSEDMRFFKVMTTGTDVIMGKTTYLSLPKKPLPRRNNIVMSRTMPPSPDSQYTLTRSPKAAARDFPNGIVIGGAEVYVQMWDYIDTFIVSRIPGTFEGDTYFPVERLAQDFKHEDRLVLGNLEISILTRH